MKHWLIRNNALICLVNNTTFLMGFIITTTGSSSHNLTSVYCQKDNLIAPIVDTIEM